MTKRNLLYKPTREILRAQKAVDTSFMILPSFVLTDIFPPVAHNELLPPDHNIPYNSNNQNLLTNQNERVLRHSYNKIEEEEK